MESESLAAYLLAELDTGEGDVSLVLGEGSGQHTVTAHGIVLRRADYFRSALKTTFQEGQTRKIELPDVCPLLMRPLVRALYSNDFKQLHQDSGEEFRAERLYGLCELCERFLVPDVVAMHAYECYAKKLGEEVMTVCEYVDSFARLVGKRAPPAVLELMLPGFRTTVANAILTLDECLAIVVDAHRRKVAGKARAILHVALAEKCTFGSDLASTSVRVAERGVVEAAYVIFDQFIEYSVNDFYLAALERERSILHRAAASLPLHVFRHLKLTFAAKVLPCLTDANLSAAKRRIDNSSYSATVTKLDAYKAVDSLSQESAKRRKVALELSRDVQESSAELFAEARAHRGVAHDGDDSHS